MVTTNIQPYKILYTKKMKMTTRRDFLGDPSYQAIRRLDFTGCCVSNLSKAGQSAQCTHWFVSGGKN